MVRFFFFIASLKSVLQLAAGWSTAECEATEIQSEAMILSWEEVTAPKEGVQISQDLFPE